MLLKLVNFKETHPDVYFSLIIAALCALIELVCIISGLSAAIGRALKNAIPVDANFFLSPSAQQLYEDQYVFYAVLIFFASTISLIFTVGFSILRSKNIKLRSLAIFLALTYFLYLTSLFFIGYKSSSSSSNRFWTDALRSGASWFYLVTPFWIPIRVVFVSMLLGFSVTAKSHNQSPESGLDDAR